MTLKIEIQELGFSGGATVPMPRQGVFVLVGPNNSGKSVALRELYQHVAGFPRSPRDPFRVIQEVRIDRQGDPSDLVAWLEEHAQAMTERPSGTRFYSGPNAGRVPQPNATSQWQAYES